MSPPGYRAYLEEQQQEVYDMDDEDWLFYCVDGQVINRTDVVIAAVLLLLIFYFIILS